MNAPRLPNALAENFQTIHDLRAQIADGFGREEIEIWKFLEVAILYEKEMKEESRNHRYSL